MRRIWLTAVGAVLAAALGVLAGGAATLALFSARTPAVGNRFTAGTLALEANRDMGDTIPGPMFYTTAAEGGNDPSDCPFCTGPWAPGDTHHRVLQIENTGDLDGLLKTVSAALAAGSDPALAERLQVTITSDPAGARVLFTGTLGDLAAAPRAFTPPIPIAVGDVIDLHFWVTLPLDTPNQFQDRRLAAHFFVYAEQAAHNP